MQDILDRRSDWYIEPDLVYVDGPQWVIKAGYIDVDVVEGSRYEVQDVDEFVEGIAGRELLLSEALTVLGSLDALLAALRDNGFSGKSLLATYAPRLPH